jgi:tetratricopeptide (TPR) repeat protein
MARALNNLGLAHSQEGDHDSARARFEESLALAREAGDRRGASMSLNNLAELSRKRRDFTAARPLYEEALAEARSGGDQGNVALCLQNLALLRLQDGDPKGAARYNLEALHIVRDLGLRALGVGIIEVAAGVAALASGNLVLGARLGGASQALFQAIGIARDPVNERMRAQVVALLRPMLSEQAFAQATAEGAALSYEAALEEARAALEALDAPATSA